LPGDKDFKYGLEICTFDVLGEEAPGLDGGDDFIELVNDKLATINRFLLFLFLVLGESSELKIYSSAELVEASSSVSPCDFSDRALETS